MERHTLQECIEMKNVENGENIAETVRKAKTFLGRRNPCVYHVGQLL